MHRVDFPPFFKNETILWLLHEVSLKEAFTLKWNEFLPKRAKRSLLTREIEHFTYVRLPWSASIPPKFASSKLASKAEKRRSKVRLSNFCHDPKSGLLDQLACACSLAIDIGAGQDSVVSLAETEVNTENLSEFTLVISKVTTAGTCFLCRDQNRMK